MRNKTKSKKSEPASDSAVLASVTKEMAQPRVAESAQLITDEQNKRRRGKPASRHAGKVAKPHIEKYGTGTPVERTT